MAMLEQLVKIVSIEGCFLFIIANVENIFQKPLRQFDKTGSERVQHLVKEINNNGEPAEPRIAPGPENSSRYEFSKNNNNECGDDYFDYNVKCAGDLPVDLFFEIVPCGAHYSRDLQTKEHQKNIKTNERGS